MLASHESGGRLNETVERIAHSVLEMQRLERKCQSETAQARKSAVYMALRSGLHPRGLLLHRPGEYDHAVYHFAGQIMLACAVVFNVVAYLWARLILNPDI